MAYKMKPNKSVLSRFKVTKTGKLKRHHAKTSHLMSGRTSKTKRRLG
jgi:large subunit ribosomal protein L35